MTFGSCPQDAVVIGGGFYGSAIAADLAKRRGFSNVVLVERGSALLGRASHHNQARVHNGYHYPRSFTTAYRSRMNLPQFVRCWPEAVVRDFTSLYAIARRNSRVTADQFKRFCRQIGAKLEPPDLSQRCLFEPRLIEDVFLVEEFAFDASKLAVLARDELETCGVRMLLDTSATAVSRGTESALRVSLRASDGREEFIDCRHVFNCTYSELNQLGGDLPNTRTPLKHEIAELALVQVPRVMLDVGITVMDGPFFSIVPFPARGLHALSHVRYTPHLSWHDRSDVHPWWKLRSYDRASRFDRMVRDASRYVPVLLDAGHVESLFEVKTVLLKNESDDGRPILFEKYPGLPGYFSVLGGKVDNVFDVLEKIDIELSQG